MMYKLQWQQSCPEASVDSPDPAPPGRAGIGARTRDGNHHKKMFW